MIVEIVEVEGTKYLTAPLEPDAWDLFFVLEKAGFNPQICCLNGYENAVTVFKPEIAYLNGNAVKL